MKNRLLAILLLVASFASAQIPVYNSYPSANAVIFLDFDGHLVTGTNWNILGPIDCGPSNLTASQITEVYNRVAEDYRPFNINITTDSTRYLNAPAKQRMRVILTISNEWYGTTAGGTAYVNSFTWGSTPCFIFTKLFSYNVKNISEATSHEAGHTLGLRHQAVYDASCVKKSDYNTGSGTGDISWAPIMGVGYYRNQTTWHNGPMPSGCNTAQDDLAIITNSTNGFGYRSDEVADLTNPIPVTVSGSELSATGLINTSTDADVFSFQVDKPRGIQLKVAPYSIASDQGSNVDIEVKLYDQSRRLVNTYNPAEALHASIDTLLAAGSYYLSVTGVGNAYASDYASIGSYSISGSMVDPEPLPLRKLLLKGMTQGSQHHLEWEIEADEKVVHQVIERAGSNTRFSAVVQPATGERAYDVMALAAHAQYRVQVTFDNGKQYYSNTIVFRNATVAAKPQLLYNVVRSGQLSVNSAASFGYLITDVSGKLMGRGRITEGITHIQTGHITPGIYLIRFTNGSDSFVEKFTRQ